MITRLRPHLIAILTLILTVTVACGVEVAETPTEECTDDDCMTCEGHGDCDSGTHCDEDAGVCVQNLCTPDTTICEGSSTITCNSVGDAYLEPMACETEVCVDGQCGCSDEGDCRAGEDCAGGQCVCASQTLCGDERRCCGVGESCNHVNICDGGQCEIVSLCQPHCDGAVCGATGELCCEGSTPTCGPTGQCAPSCEGQGELCGADFDSCCPSGDVCVFGDCRTPGAPCQNFSDCDFGEYCDAGLERCMPDDFPEEIQCLHDIDFDPFDVDQFWHWDGVEVAGNIKANVANTPMVLDMNGNGVPEVIFTAYRSNIDRGVLVIANGSDGTTAYVNSENWLRSREHHAVGDIDGDGYPEIVVATVNGLALVDDIVNCPDPDIDADGCVLWTTAVVGSNINQAPVLADVTGDGRPEVIYLHSVFDGLTGDVLASAPQGQASMPIVVDLTGDGVAEILTSGCAFHYVEGETVLQQLWCNGDLPGADTRAGGARNYVGVGDIMGGDRAGRPEVIWVGDGQLYLVDELDGDILHQFNVPGAVRGGPPVVADFDGDGRAEIGVGGQTCFTVFDLDCLGSDEDDLPGCQRPVFDDCQPGIDCVVEPCPDVPGGTGDGILWSIGIVDSVTGTGFASAVFDFQGNGRHEVVYGDHCRVFVLDGQTGTPLMTRFASRRANTEMPIVVDVDGDGRSNLLYQANSDLFDRDCEDPIADRPDFFPECYEADPPDYCTQGNQGVFALRDANDAWVRTRPVWNQHAFFSDNITDAGAVPSTPQRPWETHNTFRASRQGEVPLNAPDVVVSSVQVSTLSCPPELNFQVTVQNMGMSGIPSGLPVSLYDPDIDQPLKTVYISHPISPGGTVVVEFSYEVASGLFNQPLSFQVVANDDGSTAALVRDCNPDTAQAQVDDVICRYVL